MANSKHISEDEIKYIVDVESSKAQQEIHNLEKSTSDLRAENKRRLDQLIKLEAAGKKESQQYKDLKKRYNEVNREIKDNTQQMTRLANGIKTTDLTMNQLKKQARQLQKQLDDTSKSLNPEAYKQFETRLSEVNARMKELKETAADILPESSGGSFISKLIGSPLDFQTIKSFFIGGGLAKALSMAADVAMQAAAEFKQLVNEGIEMAKTADGITHAFQSLNRPDILDKLREATHGTVNDVELMKAAVQAHDFRIPLDQIGKYLEFAQLKASQTGQSVDYMTNSIITGLGRKSLNILDNLGLSAAEVKEQMAKGGDMATAVGAIIDKQLEAQGQHYEDAAEREKQAITAVQNAQKELGDEMLPLAEKGSSMWNKIQVAALKCSTYIVHVLKQWIAGFVDAYNKSVALRLSIQAIATPFSIAWEACKTFVSLVSTAVKTIANQFISLGEMIEGVFTLDIGKIREGFSGLSSHLREGVNGIYGDLRKLGRNIGNAISGGIDETLNGRITAPSFDQQPYTPTPTNEEDFSAGGGSAAANKKNTGKSDKTKPQKTKPDDTAKAIEKARQEYYKALDQLKDDTKKRITLTLEEEKQAQLDIIEAYYKAGLQRAREAGESETELLYAYEQAKAAIIQQYADKEAEIQKQKEQEKLSARQKLGIERQTEYQQQLAELKTALQQQYITQEEYEEKVKQLKRDSFKQQFDYYSKLFSDAVTALQEAELANVDAKYDAEIEAARKAGKDTTDLENKKANEKLKIQKKYADVNFAIKASQIIADTAVSIMKAISELGPIAGPIAAALMGVTGAAQLAVANAEREKIKKMTLNGASSSSSVSGARVLAGREAGGSIDVTRAQDGKRFNAHYDPRRRGYIDHPTVIVGEGPAGRSLEWVASNEALRNPTVAPLIDIIDRAQRIGAISTLDMRKFLLQQQARGLYNGGYIQTQSTQAATSVPLSSQTSKNPASETLQRLTTILERIDRQGIRSFVALDDFDAQQKLLTQSRNIASK